MNVGPAGEREMIPVIQDDTANALIERTRTTITKIEMATAVAATTALIETTENGIVTDTGAAATAIRTAADTGTTPDMTAKSRATSAILPSRMNRMTGAGGTGYLPAAGTTEGVNTHGHLQTG